MRMHELAVVSALVATPAVAQNEALTEPNAQGEADLG